MTPLVRGAGLLDANVVGHKFACLEAMRRAGIPVPALFAVAAAAFDEVSEDLRAGLPPVPPPDDPMAVRDWAETARRCWADVVVPDELATAILEAFDETMGRSGQAAVRACVVPAHGQPGEDSAADPFAGLSDSFLFVPRDDVLARVVACWASAFNPEAVLYRLRRGGDPLAARVAVGVQCMVPAARSFVAFTRDPRDGSPVHVIAAAYGVGEGVVQERADIDHFFVGPDGTRAEIVHKGPVLADADLQRIVSVAERIEAQFGAPQDIEGAFTADGGLYIVQSRPIVLPVPPVEWSNHNITESYPGVSSALTYTVAREFYRVIFTDAYRRLGVSPERLRANAHHLQRMVGYLDGRVYYRLDAWYALHGQMRVFEFVRGWWEHGMGLSGSMRASALGRGWRRRALREAPAMAWRMARHGTDVRDFLRWWDRTATSTRRAVAEAEPNRLVDIYRRLWSDVGAYWGVTLTNSIHTILVGQTLDALLRRWAGPDGSLLAGLLAGGPENRSLAALRSAIALAEVIGEHADARAAVLDTAAAAVWADLTTGRYGKRIAAAAAEHVRRFGDRAPGDLKLESPTPRQDPSIVLDALRPLVRSGRTVDASKAEERRVREEAERDLRRRCGNRARLAVLGTLARVMRGLVKTREDTRYCRSELYGISRDILFRLGTALVAAGHLDEQRDVLDLTVEEVLGAFEGTVAGSELRPLAAHRRAERQRCEALAAPPSRQVTDAGVPLARPRPASAAPDPAAGGAVLHGLASSGGTVRAPARVVLHPSSVSPESCRDTVLVARETDPGWLFLMTVAKGMVVERGTLLSHTAITGRLLGVPTVVAVAGATTAIPDGALVELDCTAGTVRVVQQ